MPSICDAKTVAVSDIFQPVSTCLVTLSMQGTRVASDREQDRRHVRFQTTSSELSSMRGLGISMQVKKLHNATLTRQLIAAS